MSPRCLLPALLLTLITLIPPAEAGTSVAGEIAAHERAVHILDEWIRDPFIVLDHNTYYLTGTTTSHEADGAVGIPLWSSRDLVTWKSLPRLWTLDQSGWLEHDRKAKSDVPAMFVWAPELHRVGDRWAIPHTTNERISNLLVTRGPELAPPLAEPMGASFGHRHDPSFIVDGGTPWLIWACTSIAPLKPDLSGFAGPSVTIAPANRKLGHEGCTILKIGRKYVLFGTGWSTDTLRHGTYNLYYCTADRITGPYGQRHFAGRFLGHGTPFKDKLGRWWCTAFYNANGPAIADAQAHDAFTDNAYTLNHQGTTLVPLDVTIGADGDVTVRSVDPRYARPGPEEVQKFSP